MHVCNPRICISQLESGAVADAESHLSEEQDSQRRSYLVGYTVSGYLLDRYPLATLKDHNGQQLEAEVVATFLPSEVVESLYTVMEAAPTASAQPASFF